MPTEPVRSVGGDEGTLALRQVEYRPVRRRVLGLPVDVLATDAAVEEVARAIRERQRCRIVVMNANKAWLACRDERLRAILEGAHLLVPEWAMVWAARALGNGRMPYIRGISLMRRLLHEASLRGWSVYLLGGKREVVDTLAARLQNAQPPVRMAGYHHGYLDEELVRQVRGELAEKRPDIVFVAMGSPRQEYWVGELTDGRGPLVSMGVGGSFDVLAGFKREAPRWMQGRGLEWLFRSAQDPHLLRRYLVTNTWLVWSVVRERVRGRRRQVAVQVSGSAPSAAGAPAPADGARMWLAVATQLDEWMRRHDYAGFDPYDLLASPVAYRLSLGSRWLAVAWTQLGRRLPVNLRPVLGVRPVRNPKGIALVLASYVRLGSATGDARYPDGAFRLIDWLASNGIEAPRGMGWGYLFPWANRDFFVPAGTPSSVVTAFVGHALLDAAECVADDRAQALAQRAGEFVLHGLNRLPGADGTFCFSYTPLDRRGVHNANLLAASLLARLASSSGDAAMAGEALRAARFSARAQRADGSWPYGVSRRDGWVDSFHTSYNLVALHEIRSRLHTREFDDAIERGLDFWRRAFLHRPAVGLYPGSPYPVDLHAVAPAILALLAFREAIPDAVAVASRLAEWSLREMRDSKGFFYYRKGHVITRRGPYMRWTQAWMLRALSELAVLGVADPARAGELAGVKELP